MIKKITILLILLVYQAAYAAGMDGLPDPKRTPGVANPNVTPQNIYETICVSGYS